jgi:hypothetical protein
MTPIVGVARVIVAAPMSVAALGGVLPSHWTRRYCDVARTKHLVWDQAGVSLSFRYIFRSHSSESRCRDFAVSVLDHLLLVEGRH